MSGVIIPTGTWVILCDGGKAMLMRNDGDAQTIELTVLETMEQPQQYTREMGTDRPGRVHESHDTARSAVETTDWHSAAEEAFVKSAVERFDTLAQQQKPKRAVLAAPPKILGIVRKYATPTLETLVVAEYAKDLVHMPTRDIERHLAE